MSFMSTPLQQRTSPVHRFAGAALAALDRVGNAPAWALTPDEQAEALRELTVLEARAAELRLRVLAAADRNQIGDKSGDANTAAWLARETQQTRPRCHAGVRLALALDDPLFSVTRAALAAGRMNVEQARVVVAAVADLPCDEVSDQDRRRAQRHLADLAREHDAKALRVFGRRLFEVIAPEEAERREGEALEAEERRARERCRFALRDNGDGTVSGSFTLPTVQAQMLNKALQAFVAPRRTDPDPSTGADGKRPPYAVLLGQAFAELVEHLPVDKLPQSGGMAASVLVKIDHEALRTGLGVGCLDTGASVSASQSRRLACSSGILPAVLGAKSVPLDLGRKARLFSRDQRIAMEVRDSGCTTESCDRPAAWCEAHHDDPWSQGGRTDIDHGRLLCPRHHHLAHDGRYEIRRLPGNQVAFHRRT